MSLGKILLVVGVVLCGVAAFLTLAVNAVPLRTDVLFNAFGAFGIGLGILVP